MENKEKRYIESVMKSYQEKEYTKLDELKDLDKRVNRPALIFAYIFGTIGSLVLGFGMCVAMEIILPGLMSIGVIIGLIGILMVSVNYLLYDKILAKRKAKYSKKILDLSDALLNK